MTGIVHVVVISNRDHVRDLAAFTDFYKFFRRNYCSGADEVRLEL